MPKRKSVGIRRILIVYKKSSYQSKALDKKDPNYLRLLKEKDRAILTSKSSHETHIESIETVKSQLRALKVPFDVRLRYKLSPLRGYDLVLTIGGDGTFLETSHYLEKGVVLGVNSVPNDSVGYFCKSTAATFLDKIYAYLNGSARLQPLHRLKVSIDGKFVYPLALNDILFANENPAGTTRYILKVGHREELQKSSGVWVAPAAGSTAATKSAGGCVLPIASSQFQYVVREPYAPPGKTVRLKKGALHARQRLEIYSMMDEAALFVDGPHRTRKVRRGARVVIENATKPLIAIW